MSTTLRSELSENNPYWIEKHRYYELKHFCMQYPFWQKVYGSLDGLHQKPLNPVIFARTNTPSDPTAACALEKAYYGNRISMVQRAAQAADPELASYILTGVTQGISYDLLKVRYGIPCGKDTYYDRYRKFFWLLDQERQ